MRNRLVLDGLFIALMLICITAAFVNSATPPTLASDALCTFYIMIAVLNLYNYLDMKLND